MNYGITEVSSEYWLCRRAFTFGVDFSITIHLFYVDLDQKSWDSSDNPLQTEVGPASEKQVSGLI